MNGSSQMACFRQCQVEVSELVTCRALRRAKHLNPLEGLAVTRVTWNHSPHPLLIVITRWGFYLVAWWSSSMIPS